jgi:hypothetical protein
LAAVRCLANDLQVRIEVEDDRYELPEARLVIADHDATRFLTAAHRAQGTWRND